MTFPLHPGDPGTPLYRDPIDEPARVVEAIERGIHADRGASEKPWWPAGAAQRARRARETAETHPDKGEAEIEALRAELDRAWERVAYYRDSEVPALRSNADGWARRAEKAEAEIEALRAERDSLRAALDDRNRLWGHRSRELGDLRAEVEHWKHHAWEAGEGFKRAIEDAARAGARRRAAEAEARRLAGVVERVRALHLAWQAGPWNGSTRALLIALGRAILDTDAPEASEEGRCVCEPDVCFGVPGETDDCKACLALDPECGCLNEPEASEEGQS